MEAYFDNSATTKVLDCVKDAVPETTAATDIELRLNF